MIRILCADIASADAGIYEKLYGQASPERKKRADRYLWQEDKLRCVTADALLKRVLGTDTYRIGKNDFGKPYVKDREGFYYNLSHSGRYVVIAWGDSEVGVDVQQQGTAARMEAVAERFFAPDERNLVCRESQRFYEIWTKKESYLKYIGKGLHQDLRSFSVLAPAPGIRYRYRILEGGYSLCLCTTEEEYMFELLDIRQLL